MKRKHIKSNGTMIYQEPKFTKDTPLTSELNFAIEQFNKAQKGIELSNDKETIAKAKGLIMGVANCMFKLGYITTSEQLHFTNL